MEEKDNSEGGAGREGRGEWKGQESLLRPLPAAQGCSGLGHGARSRLPRAAPSWSRCPNGTRGAGTPVRPVALVND